MTGFKAETESGVRSGFSGLAKIVGVALGATAGFEIVKSAVAAAASVQKQVEVIRSEFGSAGKGLIDFANTAGIALGATNAATLAASARFGILFQNLGIAPRLAATMTTGFEKLALSINAIRGGSSQDAATLLQSIISAAAGNTRGLRQLGITIDATSEKVAAFKLGLISSVTQALTPSQRAIAVYSIATAHLGGYLAQAKAHSHDFADVQARLTAEWQKAKETLGKALLPEITKAVSALARWLGNLEKSGKLQRDFNTAGRIAGTIVKTLAAAVSAAVHAWNTLSGAIGGAKTAAAAFLAVIAINKIRQLAGAIITNLVNQGFAQLKIATEEEKAAYVEAFGTMEIATVGLGATIKSALITTGIGALVVAVGIAVGYIVTHWSKVKAYTIAIASAIGAAFHGMGEVVVGIGKTIGGSLISYLVFPLKEFLDLASAVAGWIPGIGGKISSAARAVDSFAQTWGVGLVKQGTGEVVKGFHDIGTGASNAFTNSLKNSTNSSTNKSGVSKAGKDAGKTFTDGVTSAVGDGLNGVGKKLTDTLRNVIASARQKIHDTIRAAKDNLDKIGQELAKTIDQIQQKIGGAAGAIAGSPQGQAFAKLKKLIESGAPTQEIQRATQELSSQLQNVGKTQRTIVATELANLTSAFNAHKIGYKTFESRLHKILHENGITLKDALKAGGPAFAATFKAEVAALGKQAQAIAAIPAKYRGIGGAGGAADIKIIRPLEVIRQQDLKIATAASKQRAAQLKATEKTNALLTQMKQTQVGRVPGFHNQRPGKGSKNATKASKAGTQP